MHTMMMKMPLSLLLLLQLLCFGIVEGFENEKERKKKNIIKLFKKLPPP